MINRKTYLGDGLYAEYDNYQWILTAPRENGNHYVALEPQVLDAFLCFIEKCTGLKITISEIQGDT